MSVLYLNANKPLLKASRKYKIQVYKVLFIIIFYILDLGFFAEILVLDFKL